MSGRPIKRTLRGHEKRFRVVYVMAGRGLAVPPCHHRRRTAERLTRSLSRRTSRARSPCRGSGPGR